MIEISNGYRTTHLPDKTAALLLGVTTKTIQRLKNPASRNPITWELLTAKALGQIIPPGWRMSIKDDTLHTDTGYQINAVQLEQYGWHLTMINQMSRDNARLKKRISELEQQLQDNMPRNVVVFPTRIDQQKELTR